MDLAAFEARLTRLERQNRALRASLFALLALGGVVFAGGAAAIGDRVIEADRFVVKDGEGHTRAVLGAGSLVLYGADGKVVASLGAGTAVYPVGR